MKRVLTAAATFWLCLLPSACAVLATRQKADPEPGITSFEYRGTLEKGDLVVCGKLEGGAPKCVSLESFMEAYVKSEGKPQKDEGDADFSSKSDEPIDL